MTRETTEQVLLRIEDLVKQLLAVQLYQSGANQQVIAKRLGIAKAKANDILKGIGKGQNANE